MEFDYAAHQLHHMDHHLAPRGPGRSIHPLLIWGVPLAVFLIHYML
jgi:hypothetical protein